MSVGISRLADGQPPEPRRRDGRERLLDGAGRLLAEKGYAGMELRDVAERGNAPRGSIYHHFPGGKASSRPRPPRSTACGSARRSKPRWPSAG